MAVLRLTSLHSLAFLLVLLSVFSAGGCGDDGPGGSDSGVPDAGDSSAPVDTGPDGAVETDLLGALVATTAGTVQGEPGAAARVFRGIPYVAPPVNDLRWAPPEPVAPWDGTRAATTFGPACPQPTSPFLPGFDVGETSEDCLTANIWTPAESTEAALPVMLWIHGGGFTLGSGGSEVFDGTRLAARGDVVVVTFNYRLGPFANIAHPALSTEGGGTSGNYGLRDQIAMLAWVRDNIQEFGGDPENVTIFGESAGGGSVCFLVASPLATGLFDRAIVQSANCFAPLSALRTGVGERASAESVGVEIAESLGCVPANPLPCMRRATFEQIADAADLASGAFDTGVKLWPIVDGTVLPDQVEEVVASGTHNIVPIITGTTAREGALFQSSFSWADNVADYETAMTRFFGANAPAVLAAYPATSDATALREYEQFMTDYIFRCPARRVARALAAHEVTWLYDFSMVHPSGEAAGLGSYHGTDIFYTFGNLENARATAADLDADDQAVTEAMIDYWASFARDGVPAGPVPWPAHDASGDAHLTIDAPISAGTGLLQVQCDMFDSF